MLIVGCGDVGKRIARRARARGQSVSCLVRRAESADLLRSEGISTLVIDLDNQSPAFSPDVDSGQIFYLAPPPSAGTDDPRMRRLLAALSGDRSGRIVYISTTGVYGDCQGAWVDERFPARPQVDRARRRLDAEQQLRAWSAAGRGDIIILRVAGIYGPDKLPLARLQQQLPMISAAEAPWTNRIHIDDLVTVCEAAMAVGRPGEIYNVSDGEPGNMRDYFDRVADLYGLPRAPLISLAEARATLSPGMLSYLGESRRMDNAKLREELGVELRYPNLSEGLAACKRGATDFSAQREEPPNR
ncbi:MAG: SDR family oxidoreductase [Sedimenticolaceae bacterium]